MTRVVADASAVVDLLAGAPVAEAIKVALAPFSEIDVPEHFHVEAISALRGLSHRGELDAARAALALDLVTELRVIRHAVAPLARDIWSLRDRLSAYDAAYLAVARRIDGQVITSDNALAAAAQADGRLLPLPS